MAVDVSKRTAQIRTATYGKDVRENIAGGIEDIAGEMNNYEENMDQKESSRETSETTRQQNEATRQQNEATRQEDETARQTNESNRTTAEINRVNEFNTIKNDYNAATHENTVVELTAARTSSVTSRTFDNIGLRMDNTDSQMADIMNNFSTCINVKGPGYLAKGDGIADDTQAIQKAINDLSNLNGGIVLIPSGIYMVSTLKLKTRIMLMGYGDATLIKSIANNVETAVIQLDNPNVQLFSIRNLNISGNKNNNTNIIDGIQIISNSVVNEYIDHLDNFLNIKISECTGNGFSIPQFNTRECRVFNVISLENNGNGFYINGTDNKIAMCLANNNNYGFYIAAGNNQISNSKSFGNNYGIYTGSATANIRILLTNFISEENKFDGFIFENCLYVLAEGILSNTNGTSGVKSYGIKLINTKRSKISGIFTGLWETYINDNMFILGIDENSYFNNVDITFADTNFNTDFVDYINNACCPNKIIINGHDYALFNIANFYLQDDDSDGVINNFIQSNDNGITPIYTINKNLRGQVITINANTSSLPGAGAHVSTILNVSNINKLFATINMKSFNQNIIAELKIQLLDSSESILNELTSYSDNKQYVDARVMFDSIPTSTTHIKITLSAYAHIVGATGKCVFRYLNIVTQ